MLLLLRLLEVGLIKWLINWLLWLSDWLIVKGISKSKKTKKILIAIKFSVWEFGIFFRRAISYFDWMKSGAGSLPGGYSIRDVFEVIDSSMDNAEILRNRIKLIREYSTLGPPDVCYLSK